MVAEGQILGQGILMDAKRRNFLLAGAATATGLATYAFRGMSPRITTEFISESFQPPTFSVVPVLFDGKYIIEDPPADIQGYFHPREFEVNVGISVTGQGNSTNLTATTAAPVSFPEQEVLDFEIRTEGCQADIITYGDSAAQLALAAGRLAAGQTVFANARYRMRIAMAYQGYEKNRFPKDQSMAEQFFAKRFFRNSAGIKVTSKAVRDAVRNLVTDQTHPWDAAKIFQSWVFENIKGVPGRYTSVEAAIKKKTGDCEERAAVFIALCRASEIPARLVWVPGHNWAEIGLVDNDGIPHWIPVHTAAYRWFGWTGVHEMVLQKGDNIHIPQRKRTLRLIDDWYRLRGPRPEVVYSASVKPLPPKNEEDSGPGQREKKPTGVWELTGNHPANKFMRSK